MSRTRGSRSFRTASVVTPRGEFGKVVPRQLISSKALSLRALSPAAFSASYADQALFHPLEYIAGLALAVHGDGSVVCEMAEVGEVLQDPRAVIVNGKTVACDDVIIATHVPLAGSTALVSALLFQTKLYPYSSYVLGARIDDNALAPGFY